MNNVEMARPAQKPNVKKSSVGSSQLDQQIITGILTSRIETRDKEGKSYYYGFFKLETQNQEIPVVFKTKPNLIKGSQSVVNIYQKLAQIQSQTGTISRTELNKFQNYKYFTEQQALNILKPLIAEQKLTLTFSDVCEPTSEYHNRGELNKQKIEKDNSDPAKAKGCAETYAIKYFLTKFFLIPTTDELDPDITKTVEHSNRLKNGKQETPEQIKTRHRDRDLDLIIKKHGLRYQTTPEYQQ
ncbi:2838_t:CDS:2 [Entrophospora sp. SA101]|nr:13025_t:CDS:2 [Entrophospora sp. SA101]CAJ0847630.1 2838_t:CDS:2 [Entrophospora sp. SA101]